jgi:uncharacterized protein (TIGR02246 family)
MNRLATLGIVLAALVLVPAALVKAQAPAAAPGPRPAAAPAAAAVNPEEKAVRDALAAYVAAYNSRDAAKVAAAFAPEAALVDTAGDATRGVEAIGSEFAAAFEQPTTYTLENTVDQLRFITPDVAQVEGTSRLVSPREATISTRFVILLARQANAWKIIEVRDYPGMADDVQPYERLKELEWMVGDWSDESENASIQSNVRWGEGKAYLVRTYTAQVADEKPSSGMMVIGWDPLTGQITSWVFNSDGGHGTGRWARSGDNQWVVKADGTTRDGSPNSVTQIITLVNKDAVKTSSIDRIIAGEIAPDIEDVIMVRKAPAPGAAPAPAPAPAPATAPAAAPAR